MAKSGVTSVPPRFLKSRRRPRRHADGHQLRYRLHGVELFLYPVLFPRSKRQGFRGNQRAETIKKYANIRRNASQFILAVNLAPNGADTIADAPKIPAARASTKFSLPNVLAETTAVDTTATRDVPETTRCGMDVELASTGTISAPPPTPTVAPNAPARTPSGADIVVALARSVAETEDASPTPRTVVRKCGAEDARDGPSTLARASAEAVTRARPPWRWLASRAETRRRRGEVWRVDNE